MWVLGLRKNVSQFKLNPDLQDRLQNKSIEPIVPALGIRDLKLALTVAGYVPVRESEIDGVIIIILKVAGV